MRSRIIALLTLAALAGCGHKDATAPEPPPGPTVADVFTPGLVFSPPFLTIAVGSTVRFNITGDAHDVTFQAVQGAPQSIPVTTNQVISRTFSVKGTFPYDCRTHPGMSGSVTVQ